MPKQPKKANLQYPAIFSNNVLRQTLSFLRQHRGLITAILICLTFFTAYTTLSLVRHDHYQSFGYDLGINDQTVWRYAHFQLPLSTAGPFPDKIKLVEHVELVYALISPFYWIWDSPQMLIVLQSLFFCASGIFVYLLAKKKKLSNFMSVALLISYLSFYGVQFALWTDVHSASFAAAFLMGFIYFLDTKRTIPAIIFFLLAITAKENIGLLTFVIAFLFFVQQRTKLLVFFMAASVVYILFSFYIFFPHIVHARYLYQNSGGLFSNLNPVSFVDSKEKLQVIWYSLLSFGFLPLLNPLYLLAPIADLSTYFVIANQLSGAQGLFGQYRVTLAPLLAWITILSVVKFDWLKKWYIGAYLILAAMVVQYTLHLPLSYLSKSWFWDTPPSVQSLNTMVSSIPSSASVVAQNNILPHVSHRDKIYSLYPEVKTFAKNSPCDKTQCNWFRWYGHPEYLLVDTSTSWDIRHLLANRPDYIDGLNNLEKAGIIKKQKQIGTTTLYKINKNPGI